MVKPATLFENIDHLGPAEQMQPMSTNVRRRSFATLNFKALQHAAQTDGAQVLNLNLFPDVVLQVQKQSVDQRSEQNYAWIGSIVDNPSDEVILTVVDGMLAGTIQHAGTMYRVRGTESGVYEITEVDQGSFAPEHGYGNNNENMRPYNHDSTGLMRSGIEDYVLKDSSRYESAQLMLKPKIYGILHTSPATIDIGVVYTWGAKGVEPSIQVEIQHAVDQTNQAFANSGIYIYLQLKATAVVSYSEIGGDLLTDLERLKGASDGHMDTIHNTRNLWNWQADIISLIVDNGDTGTCGRGYQLDQVEQGSGWDDLAFNVVNVHCMVGNHSFAHEVGHNLGGAHDANADNYYYGYNHGYVLTSQNRRTIMAYRNYCEGLGIGNCPRITHYSNPDVNYNGQPTGVVASSPYRADNRRELDNVRRT